MKCLIDLCSLYIIVVDSLIGLCNLWILDLGSLIGLCDLYILVVGKINLISLMGWWLYLVVEFSIVNLVFIGVVCYLFVIRGFILIRGVVVFIDFCFVVSISIIRYVRIMVGIY